MVDSVSGTYSNPFVLPPSIYHQFQYFNTPQPTTAHRPMDRRNSNGRRERMTYDRNQLKTLEDQFKSTPYPDASKREQLAKLLHLEENRIQVWFKNRRAKGRAQNKVGTPGGTREDGGSSSVSPRNSQPPFKHVSQMPFIPLPTPPKEEHEESKPEVSSAFTSIKKEGEEMVVPAAQPLLPANMDWSNYLPQFNTMHYGLNYPNWSQSQLDCSNFMATPPPYGYPYAYGGGPM